MFFVALSPAVVVWIIAALLGVVGLFLFVAFGILEKRNEGNTGRGLMGMILTHIALAMTLLGALVYAIVG